MPAPEGDPQAPLQAMIFDSVFNPFRGIEAYFKVVNGKLEAKDVDGNCIWYSPSINIADYKDVSLSISATESGGLENVDIINSEYRVDGGPWSYFSTNGQQSNDFGSMTISQSGLSGSIVEIRVTVNVDQSNEQIRIDDIKVTGKRYKETICFGTSTTLGGSPSASWSGPGTPVISYEWSPAAGLSATNIPNPDANPTVNTTYKLVTILDDNGTICRDSSYYYLTVSPQILIISDDLNCDLGAYGNKEVKSPNIDALAKKGVQFNNAHCQYPHCGPSRSSIMTGMYSDQTKILENNIYLRSTIPDVITLAQRFKQQGYQSIRKLEEEEINAIPLLCHASSLRFLLTRIDNWKNKNDLDIVNYQDPMEFLKRLEFHELNENLGIYNLNE